MDLRPLGRTSIRVSRMGLGCMGMSEFYGPADEVESRATLELAVDRGINLLDTADVYGEGKNEELLAEILRRRRGEIVLATKFGIVRDPNAPNDSTKRTYDGKPEYVRRACEASLRRLRIEVVDLYYQHRPDLSTPIEETVGEMAKLVKEGKVRALGLSETPPELIRRGAAVHPIAALQNEYSLWTRDPEDGPLAICRELGITLVFGFLRKELSLLMMLQALGADYHNLLAAVSREQRTHEIGRCFGSLPDKRPPRRHSRRAAWHLCARCRDAESWRGGEERGRAAGRQLREERRFALQPCTRVVVQRQQAAVEQRRIAGSQNPADEGLRRGSAPEDDLDPDPRGEREGKGVGRSGLRRGGLQLGEQRSQRNRPRIVVGTDGRVVSAADELGQEMRAVGGHPVADDRQRCAEAARQRDLRDSGLSAGALGSCGADEDSCANESGVGESGAQLVPLRKSV